MVRNLKSYLKLLSIKQKVALKTGIQELKPDNSIDVKLELQI